MSKNKRIKGLVSAVLVSTILLQGTPTFAEPNNNVQTSVEYSKIIEDQVKELQKQLEKVEVLQIRIQKLDDEIIFSTTKIDSLNIEIEKSKKDIEEMKKELDKAQKEYEEALERAKDRVRNMHLSRTDRTTLFLEVLLESEGFSDFFQRTSALSTIMESDEKIKSDLEDKKNELTKKEKELNKALETLENKKEILVKETNAVKEKKDQVLVDLEESNNIRLKLEEEISKNKEIERRLKQEEEEKRRLEEERYRLEEERRRLAETMIPSTIPSNIPSIINPNVSDVSNEKAQRVISEAYKYLGTPYVWGGTTPSGFDCSGYMRYIYKSVGVDLPRVSRDQQNYGTKISLSQVQPGDMVFRGSPAYHVGMYIGNGMYIHAPQTGDVVKVAKFNPSNFTSATRVLN